MDDNQRKDDFIKNLKQSLTDIIDQEYRSKYDPKTYTLDDQLPCFGNFQISRIDRLQQIYKATQRTTTLLSAIKVVNTFRLKCLDDTPVPSTWYTDGILIYNTLYDLIENTISQYPNDHDLKKWWSHPKINRIERQSINQFEETIKI